MNFPALYKKNKNGSFQKWVIWTDKDCILSIHGKENGNYQKSKKIAKSKNIGKKNETTPEQQAELTAQSMWNKKKDKGYFETKKEAEEEIVFLPMLAHDILKMTSKKVEQLFEGHLYTQPKMDGVRCLARWNGEEIQLISRGGKEYTIPHISKALESVIRPGQVLDGEIYIHGVLRQDINALVKKHRDKEYEGTGHSSNDLQYWIYDTFNMANLKEPFSYRDVTLSTVAFDHKVLIRVPTSVVLDKKGLEEKHKFYINHDFEGTIIRTPNGIYELGHRSRDLIKYKDFLDSEYKIIDFTEGDGKFKGCVIWVCVTKDNKRFNVVPKGTLKQKQEWFNKANDYIGKEITVKYQGLTFLGIPEFPVGLGFRLEKDI